MKIFLFLIIILATVLRLYNLSSVPPSASLDEASIGWNAYSILQTGKDEYNSSFPILLRAYDDFRPALYVYFVVPFIKIFDLNVLSVRLPSVIFSIFTVLATYFLVKEMFKKQKVINAEVLAIVSSFLLAVSPWHIYISRLGHEVNIGLSFLILGVLFFLKKRIYIFSLFFLLSFVSYQSEKIFIPILVLGILFIFKNEIFSQKKKFLIAAVLAIILLLPFFKATFEPGALIRFSGTNVFKANESRFIEQSQRLKEAVENKDFLGSLFFNRRIVGVQLLSEGYLSHFNPVWIFTNPSEGLHKIPNIGLLYIWELPFVLMGIYFLIKGDFDKKIKLLIFLWFLAAPLPASFTTGSPHAMRTFQLIPTFQIFSAIGILMVYSIFKKSFAKAFLVSLSVLFFLGILYLFKQYFYVFPQSQSRSFQYSLSKTFSYVLEHEKVYKKVVFDNRDSLFQSYMFFLFYTKYPPALYHSQGGTLSGGYSASHSFGKFEFRNVNFPKEKRGNLFVVNYNDLKSLKKGSYRLFKVFDNLKGEKEIAIISK